MKQTKYLRGGRWDTQATLIILPRASAVLTVCFNAGDSFSSLLSGFAMSPPIS
jgi:hypothetical protein